VSDYVLTADFFDQIVERRPDRSALRIVKHRKGAILSDLTDADAERLLSVKAIRPYSEPVAIVDADDDEDPDDPGTASPGDGESTGDSDDLAAGADDDDARPLKTATVTEWRKYAESKGLPKAEAAELTRAELISRFGGR